MTTWQQVAIAVLVFLGGGGGLFAFIRSMMDRPKIQADAAAAITNAATAHMVSADARMERLEQTNEIIMKLLDETREQLEHVEADFAKAQWQVGRLNWFQQRTTKWHQRHTPFDQVMQEIALQLRVGALEDPTVLDKIPPLEPFPHWDDLG